MFANLKNPDDMYQSIPDLYTHNWVLYRSYSQHTHLHKDHWRRAVELEPITEHQRYGEWIIWDILTRKVVDFTQEEINIYEDNKIPLTVSPRDFRIALIKSWISMAMIRQVIDAIEDETQREIVDTMREYSLEVNRKDPILLQFSWQLGMTQDNINSIFKSIWSQGISV